MPFCPVNHLTLNEFGEFERMLFELTLDEAEGYISLGAVRVKATVVLLHVAFVENRGVFAFSDSEVGTVAVVTHDKGLHAACFRRVSY